MKRLISFKHLFHSIYFRLTVVIFTIVVLFGVINSYIIINSTRIQIEDTNNKLTSIISRSIGKTITQQMLFSDPGIFQGTINSLVDNQNILFAFVTDKDNNIVVHTFSPVIPDEIRKMDQYADLFQYAEMDSYGEILLKSEKILNGLIGNIVLGIKVPNTDELWFKIVISSIISLVLIITTIILNLSRSLTTPLYKLINSIEERDKYGIPANKIEQVETYEFKQLTDTMNSMVASIKESHIQLKSIFDYSLKTSIITINRDGIITTFNSGAEIMLGYDSSEIVGKESLLKFHDMEEIREIEDDLSNQLGHKVSGMSIFFINSWINGYEEREWTYIKKNGDRLRVNLIITPIKDDNGEINGLVGFGHDITIKKMQEIEIKRVNSELTAHKENLENIVEARTLELQISLNKLQTAQEKLVESEKLSSLGSLVAGVAHEINTPVGIGVTAASHLDTYTRNFSKKYKESTLYKSDFEEYLEVAEVSSAMILSNMKKASNLISSFKQVAVDRTNEIKRSFYIRSYIDEILMSINSRLSKSTHRVDVICKEEFEIVSYPGILSQIITNLIFNSLLHGFENITGGIITIELINEKEDINIIYRDNGIGIPESNMNRIYEPFYTTKRGNGGSGLGLNIVYNLIKSKLSGTIVCSSVKNKFTEFSIRFAKNIT